MIKELNNTIFYDYTFNHFQRYFVFTIPILVDIVEPCDIIFQGPTFALISGKDECQIMYF